MRVETERFGVFELEDSNKIVFPTGLPGFEELREFIVLKIMETRPIYWLQSIDNKYISLPVIIPFEIFEDYCIEIEDDELSDLNIESQNDILIMNVVVIPENIQEMTVNMVAPVIINAREGVGKQIIIDAKDLSVRRPVFDDIMKAISGGEEDAGSDKKKG